MITAGVRAEQPKYDFVQLEDVYNKLRPVLIQLDDSLNHQLVRLLASEAVALSFLLSTASRLGFR